VHGLPSGGVRVRVHDLPVDVNALATQLAERTPEPTIGLVVLLAVALRRHDQEARLALCSTRADPAEELG